MTNEINDEIKEALENIGTLRETDDGWTLTVGVDSGDQYESSCDEIESEITEILSNTDLTMRWLEPVIRIHTVIAPRISTSIEPVAER